MRGPSPPIFQSGRARAPSAPPPYFSAYAHGSQYPTRMYETTLLVFITIISTSEDSGISIVGKCYQDIATSLFFNTLNIGHECLLAMPIPSNDMCMPFDCTKSIQCGKRVSHLCIWLVLVTQPCKK